MVTAIVQLTPMSFIACVGEQIGIVRVGDSAADRNQCALVELSDGVVGSKHVLQMRRRAAESSPRRVVGVLGFDDDEHRDLACCSTERVIASASCSSSAAGPGNPIEGWDSFLSGVWSSAANVVVVLRHRAPPRLGGTFDRSSSSAL